MGTETFKYGGDYMCGDVCVFMDVCEDYMCVCRDNTCVGLWGYMCTHVFTCMCLCERL